MSRELLLRLLRPAQQPPKGKGQCRQAGRSILSTADRRKVVHLRISISQLFPRTREEGTME
jgi:hypothetical protein